MQKPTTQQIAAMFGCTQDQVRAQFKRNAEACQKQAEKAEKLGRKVGGNTAAQWRDYESKARAGMMA